MSQNPPANGGKKIKPPPPPPGTDPLSSSTRSMRSSPRDRHLPQQDTSQHLYSSNDAHGQTHPSYRALTSANDAVAKEEAFRLAKRFILNQPVSVNIDGCGWLVGTVVFLARTFESLTGSLVRVRYTIPTERNERESDFPNHPDHIRPL